MSNPFGKKIWMTAIVAGLFLMALSNTVQAQFLVQQIGGVKVDPSGVLVQTTDAMNRDARQLVLDQLAELKDDIRKSTQLRMVSVRGLEAALAHAAETGTDLPDEIKFMAGIQRIQYLFVDPETNDLIIAGPGEGWTADEQGNVVGITTGRPVIRFEDFIVALRTAEAANKDYGISVSINPSEEGTRNLQTLFRRKGFDPSMQNEVERALGPQNISFTGLPTDSRMAQVLVVADYRMKRLAMGFEPAAVAGMPSILELAEQRGQSIRMTPRFWMECSYEPLRKSEDGLSWELRGAGVKTLTENQILTRDGSIKKTKDHPIAKKWAQNMTERFAALADADPIFAELQNVMDMSVIAAIIEKHNLLGKAGIEIPHIAGVNDNVELPKWSEPKTVSSQCSFVRIKNSWMVTMSGGVQVDSWSVLEQVQIDESIADTRARASLGASQSAWWNSVN